MKLFLQVFLGLLGIVAVILLVGAIGAFVVHLTGSPALGMATLLLLLIILAAAFIAYCEKGNI